MKYLSRLNQADTVKTFYSISRHLDKLLNIDNIYFDPMVESIYPTEHKLNKVSFSDTEAPSLDFSLCTSNGIV